MSRHYKISETPWPTLSYQTVLILMLFGFNCNSSTQKSMYTI